MSDSENVESKKKGRATAVDKRSSSTAGDKDEAPVKRGRGRPKGTIKKNEKKHVIIKKTKTSKGRGRTTKKDDSSDDDTEDNETENNESDE